MVARIGASIGCELLRPGFYPAGGGALVLEVIPTHGHRSLDLEDAGPVRALRAEVLLAHLPDHIVHRKLDVIARGLGVAPAMLATRCWHEATGPGNAAIVTLERTGLSEVVTAIGRKGLPAEAVAQSVVDAARRYLQADVPVGEHLADLLLVPLALAGGGVFLTLAPSPHTRTNIVIIEQFLGVQIRCQELGVDRWRIAVPARASTGRPP